MALHEPQTLALRSGDGDVPHPAQGGARRKQVPDPSQQHKIMVRAWGVCALMGWVC